MFVLASLLCGLASTPTLLDVARGLQGIGGAAMFATSLALLAQEFEGKERANAFGDLGRHDRPGRRDRPAGRRRARGWHRVGVDLLHQHPDRRVLRCGCRWPSAARPKDPSQGGVDLAGVVTFSAALFCLVFALIRGNAEGWGSPLIVALLIASVVLLAGVRRRRAPRREPDVRPRLFRKPTFTGASIVAFTLSASMFAMFLYITLYLQNVLDY